MLRILIVEDSTAMRTFACGAFETSTELGEEVEIVEAASGFDALRLLPRQSYDLVVTDINMPDINGLELIRFVRKSEHLASVAVLVISTQASERDRARVTSLGADEFLAKPFTAKDLLAAAGRCLDARRAQRASVDGVPARGPEGP